MKKMIQTLWAALLVVGLAGCGGSNNTAPGGTPSGSAAAPGKNVTIKIFQFKVEIAEALGRLCADYEREHPGVKIAIDTVGGGADYGAALKAKFASGDEPDIFNNAGYTELTDWLSRLEDLSDQPWVADVVAAAKEPMTKDGKMYGMPMNIEGYGFVYNKDLFAKAGISTPPKTLTELKAAANKLKAAKITPFANGYGEWWILGIHNFNVGMAHHPDPAAWAADRNAGKVKISGDPVFDQWANLLDTTIQYGNKNPLTTDYNTQVTLFASGRAAMMQQGNWTQVQIDKTNPNLNIGVMPMPINDDPAANDKLFVGVPNNWAVNKNSQVKQEAKAFLNWLVSSDTGKKYLVNEFKFIPAFKSVQVSDPKALGPIAGDIMQYSKSGKTLPWVFFRLPNGVTQEIGAAMQSYIAKKTDRKGMFGAMDSSWDRLSRK